MCNNTIGEISVTKSLGMHLDKRLNFKKSYNASFSKNKIKWTFI